MWTSSAANIASCNPSRLPLERRRRCADEGCTSWRNRFYRWSGSARVGQMEPTAAAQHTSHQVTVLALSARGGGFKTGPLNGSCLCSSGVGSGPLFGKSHFRTFRARRPSVAGTKRRVGGVRGGSRLASRLPCATGLSQKSRCRYLLPPWAEKFLLSDLVVVRAAIGRPRFRCVSL